jgi:hypothetical protein
MGIKLKHNLYRLVQASRNWFIKLSALLYERLGFKQSKYYPCVFVRKYTIIVLYTDTCLLYAQDITLNDPDPIDDFLGIHFSHQDNGELHMSQTGPIDTVAESAHIPKGRIKNRPAPATAILHADTDGLARQ